MIKIGITGTVGKTTTCLLLHNYLTKFNRKVLTFTTAGIYFNNQTILIELSQTTFTDKNKLNEYINKFNPDYLILELTAERSKIFENDKFDLIALTNFLSGICQSFDNTEKYLDKKLSLFNNTKSYLKVLNSQSKEFINKIHSERGLILFGNNENDDIVCIETLIKDLKLSLNVSIRYQLNNYNLKLNTNLLTEINKDNILCVISILVALNILDIDTLKSTFENVIIPGRLEYHYINKRHIIIDSGYNGIEGLFPLIKLLKNKNIISVVCTYNFPKFIKITDLIKEYRREKGLFFTKYSKLTVFTEYGRYDGDENESLRQLTEYLIGDDFKVIQDRYKAIEYALNKSKTNDYILLIGKGNEVFKSKTTDIEIIYNLLRKKR